MTLALAVWSVLLELAPWLLLGATVSALLHGLLPPGWVERQLSGSSGVLKAVLLGIPLPLCSCGVIPAGIGLRRDGASSGSAVGFLTATPQTGVDSILVSAGFLGLPFALTKVVAALATGLAAGLLVERYAPEGGAIEPASTHRTERPGVADMAAHGIDMVRMIWRWLAFGVIVSAALSVLLPADAFASLTTGGTVAAFGIVLLASVPLYVCATASVPIAAALVGAGMPTGAALVFLMAGPATNLATLGAVRKAFGGRALGLYLSTLVLGSLAFGLGYEAVIGPLVTQVAGAHEHTTWWAQASAVALLAAMGWFAVEELRAWLARRALERATEAQVVVPVQGMTCDGCAARLERVLRKADGVEQVSVSYEEGSAVVLGLEREQIDVIVRKAGFEPGQPQA